MQQGDVTRGSPLVVAMPPTSVRFLNVAAKGTRANFLNRVVTEEVASGRMTDHGWKKRGHPHSSANSQRRAVADSL
jgi:hypothetical protein